MQYVFGPVPSRRLGRSLGVDPVPAKTCDWNCVYCQLGPTPGLTPERSELVPAEAVVEEVRQALSGLGPDRVDWITIVGSGEPTLHSGIGRMIEALAEMTELPVAVITNGHLLADPRVRGELLAADAVMPTVSAADEDTFLRLHRPAPGIGFEAFVEGLVAFREQYRGKLWAEVMLVEGVNDSEEHLQKLAELLGRIRPDGIQVVLPTRAPSEPWVRPSPAERVSRAAHLLGAVAPVTLPSAPLSTIALTGEDSLEELVVGLVTRHPMTERQLAEVLPDTDPAELHTALARLEGDGRAHVTERQGKRFWVSRAARHRA